MNCNYQGCEIELSFRASTDPDEGWCLYHGTRYVNVTLGIPLLHTKTAAAPEYKCIDCGQPVSGRDTKRCRKCLGKHFSDEFTGDKRFRPRVNFVVNAVKNEALKGRVR